MKRGVAVLAVVLVAASCSDTSGITAPPVTSARTTAAPEATTAPAVSATGHVGSETVTSASAVGPSGAAAVPPTFPPDEHQERRTAMVDDQIEARGITDEAVLQAMRTVPRHLFVPEEYEGEAYRDHPLPIGYGQTISQPYMVALMTESLGLRTGDRVLEVGTGSGYQAAVLGQLGHQVYTVEIIPKLAERSTALLAGLGYENVATRSADGYFGWEEHAPFDAIIVTAAPDHVPQPLVGQLAPGGRMVIPVGPVGAVQTLWRFTADPSGELIAENLGGVAFVPFTRDG